MDSSRKQAFQASIDEIKKSAEENQAAYPKSPIEDVKNDVQSEHSQSEGQSSFSLPPNPLLNAMNEGSLSKY
jgi:hypothetical protein